MHRELKAECTLPPAKNMAAQQRAFNRFTDKHNTYRPHEALGNDTPQKHYHPSYIEYKTKNAPFAYADHLVTRRVSRNGAIRWPGNRWLYVSTTLIEEDIALEKIDTHTYCVWFHNFKLGHFNTSTLRIVDYLGRTNRLSNTQVAS